MKDKIEEVRDMIKKLYALKPHHKVLFTGNGTTGAINHLANCISYEKYKHVNIYLSTYEHYSNYLPWIEIQRQYVHAQVKIIPFTMNEQIDMVWLEDNISKTSSCDTMNIISVTICSNVSGVKTDIDEIVNIAKKYSDNNKHNNYVFADCAALAPHEIIKGTDLDAMFISPHKFLGGTSTPGLLIAHQDLFLKGKPYNPGGGCVRRADTHIIIYEDDIEKKETGGTPNIIGILRLKYVYDLQVKYLNTIKINENIICGYVNKKISEIKRKYGFMTIIAQHVECENKIPIISFNITGMHYNYVVVLLNDIFGIQSRGGISCCGMLGEYLKKVYNIEGWCRLTFNWMMSKEDIDYILRAVEYVVRYGTVFSSLYKYDRKASLYNYVNKEKYHLDPHVLLEKMK